MTRDPKLEALFNNPEAKQEAILEVITEMVDETAKGTNEQAKAYLQLGLSIKVIFPNCTSKQMEQMLIARPNLARASKQLRGIRNNALASQ